MLALYQPHNVLWLLPVSLLGGLLFAISCTRRAGQRRASPVAIAFWCLAAGGIVGMIAIHSWDTRKLRDELRSVKAAEATHVALSRGPTTRDVADPAAAARLLGLLQGLKAVPAHHSHPVDEVIVSFEAGGERYCYGVGRDSAVPNEYWVMCRNPGIPVSGDVEIGRLQTAEWQATVDALIQETK